MLTSSKPKSHNFLDQGIFKQHPLDFQGLGRTGPKADVEPDRAVGMREETESAGSQLPGIVFAQFLTGKQLRIRSINSDLLGFQYGAMVSLEPVWNTKTLLNNQGHELHMSS